tara:strand:- start:333 stop:446 length:114 start_codon:yes stop_codon:yes gene_type:complete
MESEESEIEAAAETGRETKEASKRAVSKTAVLVVLIE